MEKYHDSGFSVVGMNQGDSQAHIQMVFRDRAVPWRSFHFGENYAVCDRVGVNSFPTYILLDRRRRIVSVSHEVDLVEIEKIMSD